VAVQGLVTKALTGSPECMGLPIACWYIGLMMLFIPFPFSHIFHADTSSDVGRDPFPQGEVS
jgi:UDP-N-acetylglucosamine--dolichyl-phosphate N-acetylglucosaminephosphotransferase